MALLLGGGVEAVLLGDERLDVILYVGVLHRRFSLAHRAPAAHPKDRLHSAGFRCNVSFRAFMSDP